MKSFIPYDTLVEDALRGVVETVLRQIAREGILGDHHFYITFRTSDPHVVIPAYLREKYPSDMTIVLQYQYSDLVVSDIGFSVCLSFNNIPESLHIPFKAITGFADPYVKFGLQFHHASDQNAMIVSPLDTSAPSPPKSKHDHPTTDKKGSSNVISLDTFRK
jgi:hypothetical protein